MKLLAILILSMFLSVSIHASPAPDAVLSPGDVLRISVYGNPDLSLETKVGESGTITYPMIGQIPVIGMDPRETELKIAGLLSRGGFIRDPQVSVLVMQMQNQQVAVLGLVNRPGRYPIDGKRSVADLLAMAGGVGTEGGDIITLIRTRDGTSTRQQIDLLEMVRNGDPQLNPNLSGGDILYIERAPKFYIYGEVNRPGTYRLERNMTILHALSAGGGLTPRGTERGIRIKRRDTDGKLQEVQASHYDTIESDDIVYIRESLF